MKLHKRININKHSIDLKPDKQQSYRLIHSIGLVEFKTVKTYIKTNQANGFICSFKSFAEALMIFIQKPNGSIRLYVDFKSLNNQTIKNWYLLPLINKMLNRLDCIK